MTYIDIDTAEWAANLLGYRPKPQPYTEASPTFLFVRPAWHARAACRGMGHRLFFPERGDSITEPVAICDGCTVRADCLEANIDERFGVWASTSERQRRQLRKRLALKRAA